MKFESEYDYTYYKNIDFKILLAIVASFIVKALEWNMDRNDQFAHMLHVYYPWAASASEPNTHTDGLHKDKPYVKNNNHI